MAHTASITAQRTCSAGRADVSLLVAATYGVADVGIARVDHDARHASLGASGRATARVPEVFPALTLPVDSVARETARHDGLVVLWARVVAGAAAAVVNATAFVCAIGVTLMSTKRLIA